MNIQYLNHPPYPNRWMITLTQQGSVCDLESSEPGCQEDDSTVLLPLLSNQQTREISHFLSKRTIFKISGKKNVFRQFVPQGDSSVCKRSFEFRVHLSNLCKNITNASAIFIHIPDNLTFYLVYNAL